MQNRFMNLDNFFICLAYDDLIIRRPKSDALDPTLPKTNSATDGLSAKGDGFEKSSDQCGMSQSDKDVLGYVSNS